MACGKSTIVSKLANQLNCPFIDTDLLIEARLKENIKDFILDNDENSFRIIEREILNEVIGLKEKSIIATGGGLPCFFDNSQLLRDNGLVIFIDTPEEVLFSRLLANDSRPLTAHLNPSELMEFINLKLEERRSYYEKANITITGNKSITEICSEIQDKLELIKS